MIFKVLKRRERTGVVARLDVPDPMVITQYRRRSGGDRRNREVLLEPKMMCLLGFVKEISRVQNRMVALEAVKSWSRRQGEPAYLHPDFESML